MNATISLSDNTADRLNNGALAICILAPTFQNNSIAFDFLRSMVDAMFMTSLRIGEGTIGELDPQHLSLSVLSMELGFA